MATTPNVKYEHSPADSIADSFVSTPGTNYPILFPSESMNPYDTPDSQSYDSPGDQSIAGTPAPEKEKKPVKKRKSWGQQLPEPKTNLPPRKRAKTEDEKEQRRVERVLRNRRAAQTSRERKRQEVEQLEDEKRQIERQNTDLQLQLAEKTNMIVMLEQALERATGEKVYVGSSTTSSPGPQYQTPTPLTLSQSLFGSRDGHSASASDNTLVDAHQNLQSSLHSSLSSRTVNPASLSPEMGPVVDQVFNASSSDMTQHPAAMLCDPDLQCQSEEQRPWMTTMTMFAATLWMMMVSEATSTVLTPISNILVSLRTGSSLMATPSIMHSLIWMLTTTAPLITTSTNSSTKTSNSRNLRPRFSLRIGLLRRVLACSPKLARPLMAATVVALRLASEQQLTRDCLNDVIVDDRRKLESSPTVESLMTLLWTVNVIDRERQHQDRSAEVEAGTGIRQVCMERDNMFRQKPSVTGPTSVTDKSKHSFDLERGARRSGTG